MRKSHEECGDGHVREVDVVPTADRPAQANDVIVKTETRSAARSAARRAILIRTTASSSSRVLAGTRASREPVAPLGRERRPVELAGPPLLVELGERGRDPVDVVRGDDDAGAGAADERRGLPVRRHHGEDRPLGGEVLEDLAREHAAPATVGLRDEQQEGVRVALERRAPRPASGASRTSTRSPSPSPARVAPGRPTGSRRRSGRRRRRPSSPARPGTAGGRGGRRSCRRA